MNFLEFLKLLMEKYRIPNVELLDELQNAGLEITKSNLSHKLKGDRTITGQELGVFSR